MNLAEQRSHQPLINVPREKKAKRAIPKVTKKRAAMNREYSVLRKHFLAENPWCQVWMMEHGLTLEWVTFMNGIVRIKGEPTRVPYSTEVHHVKGRGKYLLDTNTWLAVSEESHRWIHANPKIAYEKGYMQLRR